MIRGVCLCGAVRFEADEIPLLTHGHCSLCRKVRGVVEAVNAQDRAAVAALVARGEPGYSHVGQYTSELGAVGAANAAWVSAAARPASVSTSRAGPRARSGSTPHRSSTRCSARRWRSAAS
ncbi:hypothetical protein KJ059_05290 [Myxococcota bacterium]|nr:hypothetical protein [Myxococcota bacterium]MCZ7618688.1 hypothetical protein [Myxococcota bacterium]